MLGMSLLWGNLAHASANREVEDKLVQQLFRTSDEYFPAAFLNSSLPLPFFQQATRSEEANVGQGTQVLILDANLYTGGSWLPRAQPKPSQSPGEPLLCGTRQQISVPI